MNPIVDFESLKVERGVPVAPRDHGKPAPTRLFLEKLKDGESFTVPTRDARNKFLFASWKWNLPITTRKLRAPDYVKGVREYRIHKGKA